MSELIVFSDRNFFNPMFHRFGDNGFTIGELPERIIQFSVIGFRQETNVTHLFGTGIGSVQKRRVYVFGGRILKLVGMNNQGGYVQSSRLFLNGLCVNPSGLPTFSNVTQMLFPMFRPNLMSCGSLVILVSGNGRRDDEHNVGQMFDTVNQQWELIPFPTFLPSQDHRLCFSVLVYRTDGNPILLLGFARFVQTATGRLCTNSEFRFYSIWDRGFVHTDFNLFGLRTCSHILNWVQRSNLGGVEVVYSFSRGILLVVDLAGPHISPIDMSGRLSYYYQAGGVEPCLLAANGRLHLVWRPAHLQHLQPNQGCLIVWSSFQVVRVGQGFEMVNFFRRAFVVDDSAPITTRPIAVAFAVL